MQAITLAKQALGEREGWREGRQIICLEDIVAPMSLVSSQFPDIPTHVSSLVILLICLAPVSTLLPFGVYHKTMQANIWGAMKHAPVNSGAASRSYWSLSLLRVIPSFLVGNKVAPFDVQDLLNGSKITSSYFSWPDLIQC